MITIPNDIYQSAKRFGVRSPKVVEWLQTTLATAGMFNASPAVWPEEIWATYKALRESYEPDACGGSAKHLFEALGIQDTE